MTTAIYAGSFDPPTYGHRWMIQESIELFDHLIVAVGRNPAKKGMFTYEERLEMLTEICNDLDVFHRCEVRDFDGLLVEFAYGNGCSHIVRGIRSASDFDYERGMAQVNLDLQPNITTVFLSPPRDLVEVSSSMVKSLVGFRGWEDAVQRYVTPGVLRRLQEKSR